MFKTPYNRETHKTQAEKNTSPSLTIPDQSMSIPEIFRRFASGLPVGGQKVPFYDDNEENDLPDPKTMDLADIQAYQEQAAAELMEIKQRETVKRKPKPKPTPEQPTDAVEVLE